MTDVILEAKNLHTRFDRNVVHEGVSFPLHKGEILGLLGGSGSGKSVILRSIIALNYPQSGSIIYKNKDIFKAKDEELTKIRTEIAYVFQNGALFDSMTVYENLAYPLRAHLKLSEKEIKERVEEILEMVSLPETKELLPASLSGGMQKRIGLARAIILKPSIILYDEPTAGLDPTNTTKINELILKLQEQGTSGILVSHDIKSVQEVCTRISFLYEKKIYLIDEKEKFINSKDPVIQEFLKGDDL